MATRDDSSERTIEPTRLRLADARRRGIVARSGDLTAAALLVGAVGAGWLLLPGLLGSLVDMMRAMLAGGAEVETGTLLWRSAAPAAWYAVALAGCLAALAVAVNVFQVGLMSAPERLAVDFGRISPSAGVARLLSKRSAFRMLMVLAKVGSVGLIGYVTISSAIEDMVRSAGLDAAAMASQWGRMLLTLGLRICAALTLLGAVDYVYQRYQHRCDLKMTRREFLDELKRSVRSPVGRRGSGRLNSSHRDDVDPPARTPEV